MARYVMTPARRAALRKAQLISAQKRHNKRRAKAKARTRTTYHGGLTYSTVTSPGLVRRKSFKTYHTTVYRRNHLIGYAHSQGGKKYVTIEDLYVAPSHRGKGVSKKLLLHQAHATRGKQVRVTGLRSIGGQKVTDRTKIRGVKPVVQKRTKSDSSYVTSLTETAFGFQQAGHRGDYKKQMRQAHKAALRGRKIRSLSRI